METRKREGIYELRRFGPGADQEDPRAAKKGGGVDPKATADMRVHESADSTQIKIRMGKYSVEVPRPSGLAWDAVVLVATGALIAILGAFAQVQISKDK